MCHGFQITYFYIQQLSIVLVIALLGHFNLEVNDSKLGISFFNKHLASTTTTRNMQNFTV